MARDSGLTPEELARSIEVDIREINQIMRQPLETHFATGQLTAPQRIVMQTLFFSEGMSLKELCEKVALSHSTVSGIVDRLQARGMVERTTDAADRRLTRITVTQGVRDFMRQEAPRLTARPLVMALERATPAQRRSIARGLRLLKDLLGPQASSE